MSQKKWCGTPPTECQMCHGKIKDKFVDGRLSSGPWAYLCVRCHGMFGVGLGVGCGQKYAREGTEWVKIEG